LRRFRLKGKAEIEEIISGTHYHHRSLPDAPGRIGPLFGVWDGESKYHHEETRQQQIKSGLFQLSLRFIDAGLDPRKRVYKFLVWSRPGIASITFFCN
jgi:hypothetical protein